MFDILGVAVVVLLAGLFGFLALKAWGVKNAVVKWAGVILSGLLAVVCVAVLGLALNGFYKLNQQQPNQAADLKVAGTPEQIARGQKLANTCLGCHSPNGQFPLTGQDFLASGGPPVGVLYAPNLTNAGEINDWTDGEVIRAIREGVHKSGRSLLIMPSQIFRNMSDDDVQALVAFLRSQPAAGQASPPAQFNLAGALFMNLADFRTVQAPVGVVKSPPAGVTAEYGEYLVNIAGCRECHGEQLQGRDPADQNGPPAGPNLTKILPEWTQDQFTTFFNTGQLPDGKAVGNVMPWKEIRSFASDDDLQALFIYLHSLPPVEGPVK